jgi:HemK-related putative methylase
MAKLPYKDLLKGTAKVLRESGEEKEKYNIEILGKNFVIYPNVFSPKYFFDTEFFAKEIPIKKNEHFLEIGSGTGVISIFSILKGASEVVAIDINPTAVKNTEENAKIHKVEDKMTILQGDIYEPIPEGKKFDTIFWNTPFGFMENKEISFLELAVFDPGYKSTKKFIFDAKKYLNPTGRLLVGFSTTLGKFDLLEKFFDQAGFKIKLLSKTKSIETHPVDFELFEAIQI